MKSVMAKEVDGVLLRLGLSSRRILKDAGLRLDERYLETRLTDQQCGFAQSYPTDLAGISRVDFDLLSQHGFEVADETVKAYPSPWKILGKADDNKS